MSAHRCHAIGCTVKGPPKFHMCSRHWYTVPKALRDELWAAYVPGQEIRKDPTMRYMRAAKACIDAVLAAELEAKKNQPDQGELFPGGA